RIGGFGRTEGLDPQPIRADPPAPARSESRSRPLHFARVSELTADFRGRLSARRKRKSGSAVERREGKRHQLGRQAAERLSVEERRRRFESRKALREARGNPVGGTGGPLGEPAETAGQVVQALGLDERGEQKVANPIAQNAPIAIRGVLDRYKPPCADVPGELRFRHA